MMKTVVGGSGQCSLSSLGPGINSTLYGDLIESTTVL